jgi:hypothetical protein
MLGGVILTEFIDADRYQGGGNNDLSFRFIVLEHLRKILYLASTEFHGGYWKEERVNNYFSNKTYVPATHEAYSNAIDGFADILHVHLDKSHLEVLETDEKEENKLREQLVSGDLSELQYCVRRARIKRKTFRALCDWLGKNGYLESEMYEEG